MMELNWLDIGIRLGIPLMILAAIAVFFAKSVWPFITEQWKQSAADRREDNKKFIESLDRRDKALSDFQIAITNQMTQNTQQLTQRMSETTDALNKLRTNLERKPRNE